jgi:tetratricopeptide (TPR) repeat protein
MVRYEEAHRLSRENHDRRAEGTWLGNLGACVFDTGQNARAVDLFDQALLVRREVGDRQGEGQDLNNLGISSVEVGRLGLALDYYEHAIIIAREIGDNVNLALRLSSLGDGYFLMGRTIDALGCFDEALVVARDISHRYIEVVVHAHVGDLELFRENYSAAADAFQKSIELADEIASAEYQGVARRGAALVSLLGGDLVSARRLAEAACQYQYPLQDVHNSLLLGVVAYHQRDLDVAKQTFAAAIDQADALLEMTPERYAALVAKAIALCGLALCGDADKTIAARAAFRAARAITSAAGVVHRVLQLFDALALGDESRVLVDIRPAAAGESAQSPDQSTRSEAPLGVRPFISPNLAACGRDSPKPQPRRRIGSRWFASGRFRGS